MANWSGTSCTVPMSRSTNRVSVWPVRCSSGRAGEARFHEASHRVRGTRPGAAEQHAEAAGDARVAVGHVARAHLAARHDEMDRVAPPDAVEHRDVVHGNDAERGRHAARTEKFRDQVANVVGHFVPPILAACLLRDRRIKSGDDEEVNQTMFFSISGRFSTTRSNPRGDRSKLTKRPSVISSDTPRPVAGECWMPWPEKPFGENQVLDGRVPADDAVLVEHVVFVIAGPGAQQFQFLERRHAVRHRRPDVVHEHRVFDLERRLVRVRLVLAGRAAGRRSRCLRGGRKHRWRR